MLRRLLLLTAVGALVLSSCGGGEDRPGASGSASGSASGAPEAAAFKRAEADSKVDVTAHEYMFDGMPADTKGPKVFFTVKNTGSKEHEFEVLGSDGEPAGEVHVKAGDTKTVAIKLTPGKYTAVCMLKEGSKTHAELGMKTAFTVS